MARERKMVFLKNNLFLLSFFLVVNFYQLNAQLIDFRLYARNIVRTMIQHMETDHYFASDILPFPDYTRSIDTERLGLPVLGDVHFHSGFVVRIGSADIHETISGFPSESTSADNHVINVRLVLREVEIAVDTRADVENYKENGTIIVTLETLDIPIRISKILSLNTVTGTFDVISASTNAMELQWHPKDPYMQIIARFMRDFTFRQPFMENIAAWTPVFQTFLDRALNEFDFPEACYSC